MNRRISAAVLGALTAVYLTGCGRIVRRADYDIGGEAVPASAAPGAPDGNTPAYSVTVRSYRLTPDGDADGTLMSRGVTVFNSDDRELSYESYDCTSGQTNRVTHRYDYDSDGKLRSVYNSDPAGTLEYEYDSDGNVTAESSRIGDSFSLVKYYTYDDHGSLLSADGVQEDGEITHLSRYSYRYDSSGNIAERTELSTDSGEPVRDCTMSYDSCGKMTEEVETELPAEDSTIRQYTYDDNSNNIRLDIQYVDSTGGLVYTQSELREFDGLGRVTRQEYYYDGELSWFEVYEYEDM